MNELKPCPFCGGKIKIFLEDYWGNRNEDGTLYQNKVYLHCNNCGICSKEYLFETKDKAKEFMVKLIAQWNRRAENNE